MWIESWNRHAILGFKFSWKNSCHCQYAAFWASDSPRSLLVSFVDCQRKKVSPLFAKNQTVNWISKHLAKNFISNLLKKLSLKSCARETYFTLHSCPGFGSRKFSNFKLFSPQHCRKVQTNRCAGECGCEQKYKWHRLLAYDPDNDCKGIFMDWFLFPSCCVCRCNPL